MCRIGRFFPIHLKFLCSDPVLINYLPLQFYALWVYVRLSWTWSTLELFARYRFHRWCCGPERHAKVRDGRSEDAASRAPWLRV